MFSSLLPIPTLPTPTGPFKVGSYVFEIPITSIPSTAPVPDPDLTTIKFRLFYPTTFDASASQPIYWLPEPQDEWTRAYANFSGATGAMSRFLSLLTGLLRYTTVPAAANAPVCPRDDPYPVVIFSHGLGGNMNTYSSILNALASCGIICATLEHRDGSAPVSFIAANETGKQSTSISYQKLTHEATPENVEARNAQLRVRLWELELLYSTIVKLNAGERLPNFAPESRGASSPSFKNAFDLTPSCVTWVGHSFGAASIFQFVKSVFWAQSLPSSSGQDPSSAQQPLYTPAENSELVRQISQRSPVALLDMWTMPLDSERSRWLWEKPLPCYSGLDNSDEMHTLPSSPNVVGVMSEAFFKWGNNFAKTKAALSSDPRTLELRRQQSADGGKGVKASALEQPLENDGPARLFYTPKTAHLNQSDFGVLYPRVCKYFVRAEEPHRAIELNVRAVLQIMREGGLGVEGVKGGMDELKGDSILRSDEQGWVRIALDQ